MRIKERRGKRPIIACHEDEDGASASAGVTGCGTLVVAAALID